MNRLMSTNGIRKYLLMAALMLGGVITAQGQGAVIMSGDYYLTHNDAGTTVNTAATNTFNPATCLWAYARRDYIRTANSSGEAINNNNNYLQYTSVSLGTDWGNWRRGDNEEGIYYRTGSNWQGYTYYYLRLNGTTWQISNSNDNNGTLYNVTITTVPATLTDVTIATGASTISATGNYPYTLSGSYTNATTNYRFRDANHYYPAQTPTTVTPEGAWSISGSGASYVSVDENTGTITVNSLPTDGIKTITLSCTPSYSGTDGQAVTKEITLMPVLPTAITASESSMALCIGSEATATYSFTPAEAYDNVVASSSNTSVATVSKAGNTITVNAVALGSATITLNARNTSNASVCSTTISVTVQNPAATPVVSFNSSTSQVTITSATDGATIYYTTDGSTPSVHSTVYSGPFTLNSAATIKAIAAKDGYCNSEVGTGEACILQRPFINTNNGTGITFESDDAGVTFYYTYGTSFSYGNPIAPVDPTTSSTAWHTGDAMIPTGTGSGRIPANAIVKVIAAKDGCVSSPVVGRWNTSEDYSIGNWVFAYRDEGGEYHFLENVPGVNNGVSSLTNTNIFKPDVTIWEGLRYGDPNANYETGIVLKNHNEYFYLYNENLTDNNPTNPITRNDFINEMLMPEGTIGGVKMRWLYFIDSWNAAMTEGVFAELGFDKDDEEWAIPDVHISEAGLYQNLTTVSGGHYYCPVVFPAFIHEGHNYDLNVDYPVNYETVKESLNKGQSKAITAFTSEVGDATSTPGVYCPEYYEVGETNTLWHKYWFANTVTPMDAAPTGTTDIRITYQLLNGTQYCELVGNTLTLVSDPGRDLLVTVRITATPYIDGVAVPEAAQTKDYQINLLTAPPFPAPVISRVEGTNDYQMECSALGSIIEYRIDGSADCAAYGDVENTPTHPGWCLYNGPITVTTAGTVITARSYRLSPDAGMSDPVDYLVGGAMLLPPVITIDDDGNVTIAANPANSSLNGYTPPEYFYYTVNGSDPDPSNVGPVTSYYGGSFTVTNGQIVKAVAKLDGFANSAIASETYKIASGTSSYGVVTLNDYEDHNWSYYQASADLPNGYPDALHSPYPRNVQITYYGYGNKTLSTNNSATPAANTFTGNTTAADVKVGIADEGHTFLYYKTLERDANGRYPYELIPNPFYVRPAVTNYTGTQTLRLVMNDAGSDGWGGSQLIVDFSDNTTTRTFQLASGSTQTQTFTVSSGVTVTLTWVTGGGKNNECSFVLSYDGGSTIYESGANPRNGKLKVFKVAGTYTVSSYTGFYKWRVKSVTDGSIYAASSGGNAIATTSTTSDDNVMLDAEQTYYFVPIDAGETNTNNATSMQVELEAMWALAAVNSNTNYGSVERNFRVARSGTGNAIISESKPCTYSSFYPNGTTDGTTAATESDILTIHNNTSFSLSYDAKIEYYSLNANGATITANNHNLIIGRGCKGTIGTVQGINGGATDLNYTIRLESGTINTLSFVRSGTNTTVSGRYLVKGIMGCDYDRATNTNDKLSISANSTLYFAQIVGFTGGSNKDQKTFDCVFKSGSYQSGYWTESAQNGNPESDNTIQNAYQRIAYLGQNQAQGNTYPGVRCVTVEGGEFSGMCGGRGVSTNSNNSTYMTPGVITFDLRIKGGLFYGSVYGGAADNPSIGSRRSIMTGGEIRGWIAGGCNGTGSQGGTGATDGNSYIYVGGNAIVGGNNAMCINRTNGGQVFGAGRGLSGRASSVNYSYVAIADEVVISNNNNNNNYPGGGNVYGGSYNGTIAQESNVYILGGNVEGKVFGGSYGNGTTGTIPAANVTMTGGLVTDGVYGGSNNTGTVNDVTMHIDGGQVGEDVENIGYVHGGGLGNATRVTGSVNMTIGSAVDAEDYVTIYGDVYGGSAQGKTNGDNSRTAGAVTNVTMNAGKIHGSLYGGGLGNNTYAADVYGPVQVTVNGGGIHATHQDGSGAVYGCNNVNGAPQSTVNVDIYGTDAPADGREYALDAVYGGGNKAEYTGTPVVKVHNCGNSIEYVYGGGNAADVTGTDVTIYGGNTIGYVFGGGNGSVSAANVGNGGVDLKIRGGVIRHVFGGNNTRGTIGGAINVNVNKQTEDGHASCQMKIGEVFSGGNMAASQAGSITIGCTGDFVEATGSDRYGYELEGIGDVYGGANAADVTGNISLTINGGIINRVFGGNNFSGTISGKINVIINKTQGCGWYVGYVYGGGNQAAYTAPSVGYPNVSVQNGKVTYDVYGGGFGDLVDDSQGKITGSTYVEIINHGIVGRNVFGGGNAAAVTNDTDVRLLGGARVYGNVYGGGNQGEIGGNTKVIVNGN